MPNNGPDLAALLGVPVTVTSGLRTPQHNALVGGVPNSDHLTDSARDFVPQGMSMADAAAKAKQSGKFTKVLNEGDHVHVSYNQGNAVPQVSDDDLLKALTGGQPSAAVVAAHGDPHSISDDQLLKALTTGGNDAPPPPAPRSTPPKGVGILEGLMTGKKVAVPQFGLMEDATAKMPFAKDIMSAGASGLDMLGAKLDGKPVPSFSSGYQSHMADLQAQQKQYDTENPRLGRLGDVLSIVGGGKPVQAAVTAAKAGLGGLMKEGTKAGATIGGLFGAGTPTDDGTPDTLDKRLAQGATGAAVGGATGGAIPVASAVVAPVGKAVGATLGAILRKSGVMATDHGDIAANKLIQALNRDQVSASDVAQALTNAPASKPLTALDLAGTNTKRVARNLVTMPGQAGDQVTNFLENRSADQSGRVLGDIKQHLSSNTDVYGLGEKLAEDRSIASAPLWKKAMSNPPVTTDRLQAFGADPDIQAGMKEGIKLARREALANGEKFDPKAYAISGFDEAGDPKISGVPTWNTWQAAKEGLDQKIESFRSDVTGKLPNTKAVNSLVNLKNSLLKELDSVNPDYKDARAAWAGPSAAKTAISMGQDFLRADGEEITQAMSRMSDSEKDFYRIGAARAIQDKANNAADSADLSKRLFGNNTVRKQIETVFGKGAADNFGAAMGNESSMAKTNRFVLGGPTTANKLADAEDAHHELAQEMLHGGLAAGPKGAIVAPAVGALKRGINNLFSGIQPETANKLAEALTAQGQKGADIYTKLGSKQAAQTASALRKQGAGRAVNRLLSGAAAYNSVNPQRPPQ